MRFPAFSAVLAVFTAAVLNTSCSLNQSVMNGVADALSKGAGIAFTGEDDPELVGDALPFALKFYDSILEQVPDHQDLLLSTGSVYIMYANAYLQWPATVLGNRDMKKKEELMFRSRKFYLRGHRMAIAALELRHPGLTNLLASDKLTEAAAQMTQADVPFIYWSSMGWMGAYSINSLDVSMAVGVKRSVEMLKRALELDETFFNGGIHDFFITYYASLPAGMGGSDDLAREHFRKAVAVSRGGNPSPYVSLATALSVKNQNRVEYREMLEKALAVDVNRDVTNRLANILTQRKARWYLDHADDFFIE